MRPLPLADLAADVPTSGPWADAVMDRIYAEGDRYVGYFVLFHFAVGLGLAPFYDTWFMALAIGGLSTAMFFASRVLAPRSLTTRIVAGISLQAFVALHIYQLHGLPEMHFFFFSAFTMLITYQDPRAPWPGTFLIIAQHIVFAVLENSGVELNYFDGPALVTQAHSHTGDLQAIAVRLPAYNAHPPSTSQKEFPASDLRDANTSATTAGEKSSPKGPAGRDGIPCRLPAARRPSRRIRTYPHHEP